MTKEKVLSRLVRLMFSSALLAGSGAGALAQEQNTAVVEVTGTRMTAPGFNSNSPISSITAEEIRATQPVAVEEFFKALPAAVPAIGPATNNGTTGAASIDLRGLGANRTLVLINGRRLVPFNLNGIVDTNSIPLALLSRVDILTGGASVVYGADAVAGVANFNLRRNFTGVDITSSYGMTGDQHDARRRRTDLTMGASLDGGRGNVVLSIGKTKSDPLTQGERAYGITNLNSATGAPNGSATTVPGAFSTSAGSAGNPDVLSGAWQIDPASGRLVQPAQLYNTNPPNYYVTGLDRTQATALASYKINNYADVYTEVFATNSEVAASLAATGTFGNTFNVPIGNPFIPQAAREQLCARRGIPAVNCVPGNATVVPLLVNRRFTELGPRYSDFDAKTLQYTVGLKGDIAWDWTYDAYWSRGSSDQSQLRRNWGSLARVSQALNALNPTACVVNTNGCVPLNVFGGEGSVTPAQAAFINNSASLNQSVEQDVAAITLAGNLGNTLRSPFAQDPVSMSLLAEHRKVTAGTQSDAASQLQGEVLGTGAPLPDRSGRFSLKEYAVELLVPLAKDLPLVRSLNMELGYRHTEFATAGREDDYGSWKAGGEWAPLSMLRVRAMVQKATRAPNVNELFAPAVTGLSNLATDPCQLANINRADAARAGTLSNLCVQTGVPLSEVGSLPAPSSGQINNLAGGNTALGPESAKTRTVGVVIEPLPRLAISVDYYDIRITDAVSSPSTTDILERCYSAGQNPGFTVNAFCGMIGRNTINGTFNGNEARGVSTPLSNLGAQRTSGVDLNVAYRLAANRLGLDARYGNFDISLGANQVNSYTFQATPSSVERDCLGYYSVACNNIVAAPVYKRKFNQRTNWTVGAFSLGYNWRYVSGVIEEPDGQVFLPAFASIPSFHYIDLNASWNVNKHVRVNLAVTNAANKKPPIVGGTIGGTASNSGNTFPQSYDAVGRYVTLGASVRF